MKKNSIFWGIVLVLMAALVIVSEMGLTQGIGVWTILFSVGFGAALIKGIIKFDMTQILFSIAFLCIVWDDVLRIEKITPWPVLLAALLGSIGFSMIFGNRRRKRYKEQYFTSHRGAHVFGRKNSEETSVEHDYGEEIHCSVKFGSLVKYANSENLRSVDVSVSFGSASIYLDNAKVPSGEVVINIDASFAGVELYVPRDWYITNNMQTGFGGIDEENRNSKANLVNVVLIGSANFSGVEVTYV
ncbi:MAG: LiaF transmembrane domain-containing protein [Eubacterium sp.]